MLHAALDQADVLQRTASGGGRLFFLFFLLHSPKSPSASRTQQKSVDVIIQTPDKDFQFTVSPYPVRCSPIIFNFLLQQLLFTNSVLLIWVTFGGRGLDLWHLKMHAT